MISLLDVAVNSTVIETTRGLTMTFGGLSKEMILLIKQDLLSTMKKNSLPKGMDNDDAETRKAAVLGLGDIVSSLGVENI